MTTETHYLSRLPDWGQAQASAIAVEENIVLTLAHMEVLEVARAFYDLYGFSPSMRPLCKAVATSLGVESGRRNFTDSRQISAVLPRAHGSGLELNFFSFCCSIVGFSGLDFAL